MDAGPVDKLVNKFKSQAVHMSHREHTYDLFTRIDPVGIDGKLQVGPQATVRQHHSFGRTGGARGIIDHGQLVGRIVFVMNIFGTETIGEFFSEQFV